METNPRDAAFLEWNRVLQQHIISAFAIPSSSLQPVTVPSTQAILRRWHCRRAQLRVLALPVPVVVDAEVVTLL